MTTSLSFCARARALADIVNFWSCKEGGRDEIQQERGRERRGEEREDELGERGRGYMRWTPGGCSWFGLM